MTTTKPCIGIIGAGNMGNSIAAGLIQKGYTSITLSDPNTRHFQTFKSESAIHATHNNLDAAQQDICLLAVKPQMAKAVIAEIHDNIQIKQPLVISIMAGVSCTSLQQYCGDNIGIIRAMPNLPAQIHCGITALYATPIVTPKQKLMAQALFESIGQVVWIDKENDINAVTAVAGSGPAYYFLLHEILEHCAIELGLAPELAKQLVTQTAWGATQMLKNTNQSATHLREQVTSPNGTTAAALSVLSEAHLQKIFTQALTAAKNRAIALSQEK